MLEFCKSILKLDALEIGKVQRKAANNINKNYYDFIFFLFLLF
jgi:hypothetical protein